MKQTPAQVFSRIIDQAMAEPYLDSMCRDYKKRYKAGDYYRVPGGMINRLSKEDREALSMLTAEDINHRVDANWHAISEKEAKRRKEIEKYPTVRWKP